MIQNNITFNSVKSSPKKFNVYPLTMNGQQGPDEDGMGIVNAVDIDWNGAEVGGNQVVNTTGELISWIKRSDAALEYAIENIPLQVINFSQSGNVLNFNGSQIYEPELTVGPQGPQGPQGILGEQGIQGIQGPQGEKGADGTMTFEDLTEEQKASLKGDKGDKGDTGEGFSIYKTYSSISAMNADSSNVAEGKFVLIASDVNDEDNAKLYVKGASSFTFLTDLSGAQGIQGPKGDTGAAGSNGAKGDKGDTGAQGPQGLQGIQGELGIQGEQGKSAYEVAVDAGYTGTLAQWLQSLKGTNGTNGTNGVGIKSVVKTSGTSEAGTTDTYTVYNDNNVSIGTFNVYNGANGSSSGGSSSGNSIANGVYYYTNRGTLETTYSQDYSQDYSIGIAVVHNNIRFVLDPHESSEKTLGKLDTALYYKYGAFSFSNGDENTFKFYAKDCEGITSFDESDWTETAPMYCMSKKIILNTPNLKVNIPGYLGSFNEYKVMFEYSTLINSMLENFFDYDEILIGSYYQYLTSTLGLYNNSHSYLPMCVICSSTSGSIQSQLGGEDTSRFRIFYPLVFKEKEDLI